jgi:hypothetical protein
MCSASEKNIVEKQIVGELGTISSSTPLFVSLVLFIKCQFTAAQVKWKEVGIYRHDSLAPGLKAVQCLLHRCTTRSKEKKKCTVLQNERKWKLIMF